MIDKIQLTPYQHPPDAPHPEWATCDRTGCTAAATHGFKTALFAAKVCQEHLSETATDVEEFENRWWEHLPEEFQ